MRPRQHTFLIITEGEDEQGLVEALLKQLSLPSCDVVNAEGAGNLRDRTAAAIKMSGPPLQAVGIVRDAESDCPAVLQSSRDILNSIGFVAPEGPFQVKRERGVATGYAVLPDGVHNGAIEDICLLSIPCSDTRACVDSLFECLRRKKVNRHSSKRVENKARVQAYLAARATDRVVHRAGLGFIRGHFDLEAEPLAPLREFLRTLLTS